MARRLTLFILIGMFAGIALGAALHAGLGTQAKTLTDVAGYLDLLPAVFLRLIKMIIAPLVMATLITGIAAMGDSSALGRIGGRALGWFIASSLVSIGMGLVLVNLFQPGHGLQFTAVSQVVSPARGQSLLPDLPSITTVALPDGGSVEVYLDPGSAGVNQLHLIFAGSPSQLATVLPRVTGSVDGGTPEALRQLRVSTGHFSDIVDLTPGRWRFDVSTGFGDRTVSFDYQRTVP